VSESSAALGKIVAVQSEEVMRSARLNFLK